MAQDYVEPLDEGQNIEDAAEEYFQILARRCFFLDEHRNIFGEVVTFKIHDLMHDMAQQVAGKEICIANSTTNYDKKIRHLYDDALDGRTKGFMVRTKIRTYVRYGVEDSQFPVSTLLVNGRSLRTLDLGGMGLRSLPDPIGQLLHLRYLNLSNNGVEVLPKSLTKLINLQFLDLRGCYKLKELPKDLSKLVNLRTLYVPEVLEYMPLGMAKMTRLTRLNKFIAGQRKSCPKQEDKLEDLRALRSLKGSVEIYFRENYKHAKEYCGKGGYICKTEHLNSIGIHWPDQEDGEVRLGNDEDVLEDLQPHSNLKELKIWRYPGVRMPRWGREDSLTTSLPNLVEIRLNDCNWLQELPYLGRLQHLKALMLKMLKNVEYMENRTGVGSSINDGAVASNSSTAVTSSMFFPSLETLALRKMPKLKGWWRGSSNSTSGSGMGVNEILNSDSNMLTSVAHPLPLFPCLSDLIIAECPNLMSIPLCPAVKTLELGSLNERFRILIDEVGSSSSSDDSGNSRTRYYPEIREIHTDSFMYLKALPMATFQCLVKMEISGDDKVESLSEFEEVFQGCSSSLRSLILLSCNNLRSVSPGGLEYLTALEELYLTNLPELRFDETEEKEGTGMPWRCHGQCLRSLALGPLEKVINLPKGMRYLNALQSLAIYNVPLKNVPEWIEFLSSLEALEIIHCKNLESLPRALRKLTSLKEFELLYCDDKLNHRCEKPDGEYWPILQHIPNFHIQYEDAD